MNKYRIAGPILILAALLASMALVNTVAAQAQIVKEQTGQVWITGFFSDFTSSDVTVYSGKDANATLLIEKMYGSSVIEKQEIPIQLKKGVNVTKVVIWEMKPQHDYYTAKAQVNINGQTEASAEYPFSYGTVALPGFHIVDFTPNNKGVLLLVRPFNPSAADFKIELLDGNDIIYEDIEKDVSLIQNTALNIQWPFLLTNHKIYTIRAKVFTHRLYYPPLINTYVATFTAYDDVKILPEDVQVDDYGASITLRGNSQVPFDGTVEAVLIERPGNRTEIYSKTPDDIITTGKETTVGIVWNKIKPGIYDVTIRVLNTENEVKDTYETVLKVPEKPFVISPQTKQSPGFVPITVIMVLLVLYWRLRKCST